MDDEYTDTDTNGQQSRTDERRTGLWDHTGRKVRDTSLYLHILIPRRMLHIGGTEIIDSNGLVHGPWLRNMEDILWAQSPEEAAEENLMVQSWLLLV